MDAHGVSRPASDGGFTLIEAVVSLAVVSVLSVAVCGALTVSLRNDRAAESMGAGERLIGALCARVYAGVPEPAWRERLEEAGRWEEAVAVIDAAGLTGRIWRVYSLTDRLGFGVDACFLQTGEPVR